MSTGEIITWSIIWGAYLMFWTGYFAKTLGRHHRERTRR